MKLFKFSMFGLLMVGALIFANNASANDPGPDLQVLSVGNDDNGTFSALVINLGDLKSDGFNSSFQWAIGSTGLAEWDATKNPTGQEFGSVRINSGLLPSNGGKEPAGQKLIQYKVDLPINYYLFRVCADFPNSVTESIENNNCSDWKWLKGNQSEAPDLIASAPRETSAETGVAKTFTSTIKNNGGESTKKGFSNFLQITTDKDNESKIEDLGATPMNTLLAGSSAVTSKAYTFSERGIYYVRACADKSNKNSLGDIVEWDENNNCSAWTKVAVSLSDLISSAPTKIPNAGFQEYSPTILAEDDVPFTVYATIKNQGISATESTFTNVFFTFADEPGDEINYPVSGMPILQAGGTAYYSATITFTKKGTYFLYSCADKNSMGGTGVIEESNENNNCGMTEVIVSNNLKDLPELYASLPTPSSAEAGVAETFTSSVFNQGTAATGIAFTNLFQTATLPNGGGTITDYEVFGMADLAPLMMSDFTKSITFTSEGTHYIRACADKNSAGDKKGVVEENDEDNNCSGWKAVYVTDSATNGTLSGEDCKILKGESTCEIKLTLNVNNPVPGAETNVTKPTKVTVISNETINSVFPFSKSGIVVNHPSTTFFLNHNSLTLDSLEVNASCVEGTGWKDGKCMEGVIGDEDLCLDDPGIQTTRPCPSDEDLCLDDPGIQTTRPCPSDESISIEFYASPTKIFRGKSSKLIWRAPLAESCSAVNETGYGEWETGSTSPLGEVLVYPTKTTKYKISCSKGSASNTAETSITVNSINIIER